MKLEAKSLLLKGALTLYHKLFSATSIISMKLLMFVN